MALQRTKARREVWQSSAYRGAVSITAAVIVLLAVHATPALSQAQSARSARPQVQSRIQPSAQAPTDLAFEAASVKPNKSGDGLFALNFQPGGRFTATDITLQQLISFAYGAPQPLPLSQIIGGPSWIDSDRFDVVAKTGGDLQPPNPQGDPNQAALRLRDQVMSMLRTMLKDRFKLRLHTESRDVAIYALLLARSDGKLGAGMKSSSTNCAALLLGRGAGGPPPQPAAAGERPPCGVRQVLGNVAGGSVTMPQLAFILSRYVNRNVIDRTGLTGNFDMDLRWTPDQVPQASPGGPLPGAPPPSTIVPNGPSLFTALQEQLGLKLESQRGPIEVVIIDSAERPTED